MELYLLRHGIAEDAPPGHPDADRRLTAEGKKKTAEVIRLARRAGLEEPLVLSSPYARAVETARVAIAELGLKNEPVLTPALIPHSNPEAVWAELRDFNKERALLLSGHEPLMGHLAAYLLNTPGLRVDMKKSALVRIDVEGLGYVPYGTLRWMLTPRLAG